MTYATKDEYEEYTGQTAPEDVERLLKRASELIDVATMNRIKTDNEEHSEAAKKAVCAQVEYWGEVGEQIEGPLQGVTVGGLQLQFGSGSNRVTPKSMAPRSHQHLVLAGLMYRGVKSK